MEESTVSFRHDFQRILDSEVGDGTSAQVIASLGEWAPRHFQAQTGELKGEIVELVKLREIRPIIKVRWTARGITQSEGWWLPTHDEEGKLVLMGPWAEALRGK